MVMVLFFNMNIFYTYAIPEYSRLRIVILVFITTFLFPLILNLIILRQGMISSLFLKVREERLFPFIIAAVFYYMTYLLINQLYLPDFYSLYLLGATILVLIALIINFFRKISLHMIAMGGITGLFLALSFKLLLEIPYLIITLILISGLTGYARLRLNVHKALEVYVGYFLGFAILFLIILYI